MMLCIKSGCCLHFEAVSLLCSVMSEHTVLMYTQVTLHSYIHFLLKLDETDGHPQKTTLT